jgi:hypothetical protein
VSNVSTLGPTGWSVAFEVGGAAQMQSCRYDPAQREYFLSLAHLNMLVALEPGRVATKMGGAGAK